MAATETSICNLALQILGATRITSLSQDNKNARAVAACYEHLRDAELEKHTWNFARAQSTPSLSATTPDFNYAYAFDLPQDFLRLILPADNTCDWQIHGDQLFTNEGSVIYMEYVRKVTDPNKFPPTFVAALAAKIAEFTCEEITQSTGKAARATARYADAIALAKKNNAIQRVPIEAAEDTWLSTRRV